MTSVSKIEAHPTNTQDAYPPTVAVATVHGVQGVRVMPRMARDGVADGWVSSQRVENNVIHYGDDVTDVRPLVVLDLERYVTRELLVTWLRHNPVCGSYSVSSEIADQIEAQTKPPRIPEPGLYGVVEACDSGESEPRMPRMYVRDSLNEEDGHWTAIGHGVRVAWEDLIDPTLIREGINA